MISLESCCDWEYEHQYEIQIWWLIVMFEKMKERARQRQEEKEQKILEEKKKLVSLSEKELLAEILLELKRIESRIDEVETSLLIK